tara:strand:- start:811 stop:1392 length:582 start_codon:yes stop_codon:yes gene_type:complete
MTGKIKLVHSGGNSVSVAVPTNAPSASEVEFKLPQSDGSANQALVSDGSGNLSFASVAGGKILQVVESTSSTTVTTSGGTETDLLTLSITPASSSNKVLLFISIDLQATASTNAKAWVRLYRGTSSGTLIRTLKDGSEANETVSLSMTGTKLDSPSTSSAQTYTLTIARLSGGTNTVSSDGNPYFLQAMEVAA